MSFLSIPFASICSFLSSGLCTYHAFLSGEVGCHGRGSPPLCEPTPFAMCFLLRGGDHFPPFESGLTLGLASVKTVQQKFLCATSESRPQKGLSVSLILLQTCPAAMSKTRG